jgi:hypothetical protein
MLGRKNFTLDDPVTGVTQSPSDALAIFENLAKRFVEARPQRCQQSVNLFDFRERISDSPDFSLRFIAVVLFEQFQDLSSAPLVGDSVPREFASLLLSLAQIPILRQQPQNNNTQRIIDPIIYRGGLEAA